MNTVDSLFQLEDANSVAPQNPQLPPVQPSPTVQTPLSSEATQAGMPLTTGTEAPPNTFNTSSAPIGPTPTRHHYPHPHVPHLPHPHLPPMHVRMHTFDSFHYQNYRLLWAASAAAGSGAWAQQVIVGWLTYDLTRSAFLTSLALGLDALPTLIAAPLGGLLVDSWDRRKLLTFIHAYQAAITLGFCLLVFMGLAETWHIFAFVVLMGVAWVIADPARVALIPTLVPRETLVNAYALNSAAFSMARLAAPALAGAVLAVAGTGPGLLVELTLLITAVSMANSLRLQASVRQKLRLNSALPRVLEGIRYVKGQPVVLGLVVFNAVPHVVVMPFVFGLMPVYASTVFEVGPLGLGVLLASIGAGATVGTLGLASIGGIRKRGLALLASAALTGAMMVAFSRNPSMALAVPNLMVMSAGLMFFSTSAMSAIQGVIQEEFRGRVAGIYYLSFGLSPIGSLVAGALADQLGAPLTTLIGAGIGAAAFTGLGLKFGSVFRLR